MDVVLTARKRDGFERRIALLEIHSIVARRFID